MCSSILLLNNLRVDLMLLVVWYRSGEFRVTATLVSRDRGWFGQTR